MEQPTAPAHTAGSSYSPELRRRAAELSELAGSIERSLVMTLVDRDVADADETTEATPWAANRAKLCEAMLRRNLHQLHRAADDLRLTAMRFRERADELDSAFRAAA